MRKVSIRSRATVGRRARNLYLPLYQGKMIQAFDHRANSVESTRNLTRTIRISVSKSAKRSTQTPVSASNTVLGSRLAT